MKKITLFSIFMLLLCATMITGTSCKDKCKPGDPGYPDCDNLPPPPPPEKTYNIGDLYNVNGVKGIVFAVTADKKHGSILAIESITTAQYKWATVVEVTGATDTLDGSKNMAAIKKMPNWATSYPAFKYWDDKGFYIPATNELITIFNNYATIKTAVEKNGGSFDFEFATGYSFDSSIEVSKEYFLSGYYRNNTVTFRESLKNTLASQHFTLGIKKF